MANTKTITELTTLVAVDHSTDWLPVVDTSDTTESVNGTTKKALVDQFVGDTGITGDMGVQGVDGDTGIQGITGATGITGDTGADSTIAGDTGVTGSSGDTGVAGDTGADSTVAGDTGVQGDSGVTGDTGADSIVQGDTGIQGDSGITGDTGADSTVAGDTGIQGATGDTGITGNSGDTGVQGISGDTGIQGLDGDTGAVGDTGADSMVAGPKGDTGVQGDSGITGDTGSDSTVAGPKGDTGIEGETGVAGDTGTAGAGINWLGTWDSGTTYAENDGVSYLGSSYISNQGSNTNHLPTDTSWWDVWVEKGETGSQGDTGIQGDTGVAGDTGIQGIDGDTGIQGIDGDTGVQGIDGDTGVQGIDGDTGIQGISGDTGIQGDSGSNGDKGDTGIQGIDGDTGVTGSAGEDGDTGVTGATGVAGDTGSFSGTMDDIADGTTYVKTHNDYTDTEQTKLGTIEDSADVTDATNVNTAGATMNTDATMAGNSYFLDQDDLSDDSATKVASQQSIKAYVDTYFGSNGWIASGETWTYASADDPTYTFTVAADVTTKYSVGMKVKLTQTTAKYFIITAVAESGGTTTITVYGGTDYDLANAAVTSPYYSMVKSPFGFPMSPAKWEYSVSCSTSTTIGYVSIATVNIPLGSWVPTISARVSTKLDSTYRSGDHNATTMLQLSTANSSFSNTYTQALQIVYFNTSSTDIRLHQTDSNLVLPMSYIDSDGATTLYLVVRTTGNNVGNVSVTEGVCDFMCTYL